MVIELHNQRIVRGVNVGANLSDGLEVGIEPSGINRNRQNVSVVWAGRAGVVVGGKGIGHIATAGRVEIDVDEVW